MTIRLCIVIFLLTFFTTFLFADIGVKSFRKLENDLTARIDAPKRDQNGDLCAIIKVVTTQTGFTWEPDGLGIVSAESKAGEYWLYIPFGAKRLTIKHPQLGVLRDFFYPVAIEKATVYEMILTTGRVITSVEEVIESQWLVITAYPEEAAIYINDQFTKSGTYQAKLKAGTYTYRVEAPLYHNEAGKIEITDSKKELNIKLKPAFGYITVNSTPEQNARVIIDGRLQQSTTPCKSEALAAGNHTIQVLKDMYQPATQIITVSDGMTAQVNIPLNPNFAEVTVTAPEDASVLINDQLKGNGTWKGRLNPGVYSVEARKTNYKPAFQDIEVKAGENRSVNLQPAPIYGSLDIITTPVGASINIDGKDFGTTPNTINKLLTGTYTVNLSKSGYGTRRESVTIKEGLNSEINVLLATGRNITIRSSPDDAVLYIDGNRSGVTPYTGNMSFGSHTLKAEKNGAISSREISVSPDGISDYFLSLSSTFSDRDGNEYGVVKIGNQTWMTENLRTTKLNDGRVITPKFEAKDASTPSYCWYNNDNSTQKGLGALYNWYTVNSGYLCPAGWKVASESDWKVLIASLGNTGTAFSKLTIAGFKPAAGGYFDGSFSGIGENGYWWCAPASLNSSGYIRINRSYDIVYYGTTDKNKFYSVRCMKYN